MIYEKLLELLNSHPEWAGKEICFLCRDWFSTFIEDVYEINEKTEHFPYDHVLLYSQEMHSIKDGRGA